MESYTMQFRIDTARILKKDVMQTNITPSIARITKHDPDNLLSGHVEGTVL
jgi:hypothetical protein